MTFTYTNAQGITSKKRVFLLKENSTHIMGIDLKGVSKRKVKKQFKGHVVTELVFGRKTKESKSKSPKTKLEKLIGKNIRVYKKEMMR